MASVPTVVSGFSPLDDQLALVPGKLTPQLHGWLVRLSAWMPFARASEILAELTQVRISPATARRQTEAAGAAYVALQTAEAARIAQDYPPAPVTPERVVLSVDGAMVPLVHGEWAEVKTLAIGEPGPVEATDRSPLSTISYFSRLADADQFGQLALVEVQRRGVVPARAVAAVTDGAEWIQGFLDLHCDTATGILDFAHAAQRVSEVGQALWSEGSAAAQTWTHAQLHTLKTQGARPVVAELRRQQLAHPTNAVLTTNRTYLEKRVPQMAYPCYQAVGWPIGSGMVESANKLVVEARLKGSGMHWARRHVNGMLALRNLICSGRWQSDWAVIQRAVRPRVGSRCAARVQRAVAAERAVISATIAAVRQPRPKALPPDEPGGRPRPPATHPWRRAYQPHLRQPLSAELIPTKL